MPLFGRRKKQPEPKEPAIVTFADEQAEVVQFNEVLDYLTGLSGRDYDNIRKVAGIYREADARVRKLLGLKDEPVTFIKDKEGLRESKLADKDISEAMLDDGPKPKSGGKNADTGKGK